MITEKPEAIVITFPVQFLQDLVENKPRDQSTKSILHEGLTALNRQVLAMIKDPEHSIWYHSIGNKPIHEVLYVFITILGKIRYKAKVVEWQEGHEKQFEDGRKRTAKNWLVLCDFQLAPKDIAFQGCQGFRYCKMFF